MTFIGDHHWKEGNLIECIKEHDNISKVSMCLLLMATNQFCLNQLQVFLRASEPDVEFYRLKFVEVLILFQRGKIKESYSKLSMINKEDLITQTNEFQRNWNSFYDALFRDLAQIFLEQPRDWVEGETLSNAGALEPICIVGDSHVLSAGWAFGTTWYSRPYYVPGLTINNLASPFNNRYKSGLRHTLASLNKRNHILMSLGEIDYRYTTVRMLPSKNRNQSRFIETIEELEIIENIEKDKIGKAVNYLCQCRTVGQNFSVMSIQKPNLKRLEKMGLADQQIQFEKRLIEGLNNYFRDKCYEHGLDWVDTDSNKQSETDWFADQIHRTHAFNKNWLEVYAKDKGI